MNCHRLVSWHREASGRIFAEKYSAMLGNSRRVGRRGSSRRKILSMERLESTPNNPSITLIECSGFQQKLEWEKLEGGCHPEGDSHTTRVVWIWAYSSISRKPFALFWNDEKRSPQCNLKRLHWTKFKDGNWKFVSKIRKIHSMNRGRDSLGYSIISNPKSYLCSSNQYFRTCRFEHGTW